MRKFISLMMLCLLLLSLSLPVSADEGIIIIPTVIPAQAEESDSLDPKLEAMLAWALETAADDSHGYSQSSRFGPNYDCTSFVSTALMEAGFGLDHPLSTYTLVTELPEYGFRVYKKGETEPQKGDILVLRGDHAEICMGDGGCVAAHKDYDGRSGDRSGHEIEYRTGDDSWGCPFCDYAQYDRILRYEPLMPLSVVSIDLRLTLIIR
ncbi:MAG: hypothetical protein IKQ04_10415 [Oscillospiraceae bacterium]|nr:hypothetical protein [Oscillospiraceae bacterium]MBR7010263.1 hypothetical protein [Oscillospiraceae bacterium]